MDKLVEISFLPKQAFTKAIFNYEYGWASLDEDKKSIMFINKEQNSPIISVEEKDLTTLEGKPFQKKFITRTKDNKFPVKRAIGETISYFIVPGDNYCLDSNKVEKGSIIVFTSPVRIFKNSKNFRACFKTTETPDFSILPKLIDQSVLLGDLTEKKSWDPTKQREEELKLAEYEGVETLYAKTDKGNVLWGYGLKSLSSGKTIQKDLETVKTLANQHKISNMKLVDRNGTIFLQGIGCEITNFPQKWKE